MLALGPHCLNTKGMKKFVALLFCMGLSTALATPKEGGTFRYHLPINPETLNPLISNDNYATYVMRLMAESLLTRDEETYEWVPLLAESFQVSADKKV